MKKAQSPTPATGLVDAIIQGIQEVKGKDIVHMDLRAVQNSVCDHFIICHGDSSTQVDAITRSVERFSWEKAQEHPWHSEGRETAQWILLDYVNVVVHVLHKDKRAYYGLEQLWSDAICNTYENVA